MKSDPQSRDNVLVDLTPGQRTQLGELIDHYELAADRGQVLSLENLCEKTPELLPHLITSLRRLRAFDIRLATVPSLSLLEQIADYAVLEPLGAGATGMVFRCRQQHPDRDVAVKVLKPLLDADEQQLRFAREIAAISAIKEEGIAAVYQTGVVEWSGVRCLWIAMELLSGGSVTEFLRRKEITEGEKLALFATIARTIRAAHRVGILHRDIKPSNVLMSDDGRPHVVDFGIAKFPMAFANVQPTETGTTSVKGTAAWMAPELLLGDSEAQADMRTEVFSLGVLLFEMLSGAHPYAAENLCVPQVSARIVQGDRVILQHVYQSASKDLTALLDRMMARDPDQRYQNLDEVLADLERLQQGEPVRARMIPLGERVLRWIQQHRGVVASLAVLSFATLAVFATIWMSSQKIQKQADLLSAANDQLKSRSDQLQRQTRDLQESLQLRDRSIGNGVLRSLQYVVEKAPLDVQKRLHDEKHFPLSRRDFAWHLMNHESSMSRANLERVSGAVKQMTFDPMGQRLYVSYEPGRLAIYGLATRERTISDARVIANGSLVVRGEHSSLLAISERRRLVELDLNDGHMVHEFPETIDTSLRYALTRNGQVLAGMNSQGRLFLAEISNDKVRELNVTLQKNPALIWFSDKDSVVNCVDEAYGWRRWSVETLQQLNGTAETSKPVSRLHSADFVEDMNGGQFLALGTTNGNLLLMSLHEASLSYQTRRVHGDDRLVVRLLPPKSIITADDSVQIHQLEKNQPPQIIETTTDAKQTVSVSADARFVAIGGEDGSVSVLDTHRPEILVGSFRIFDGQADRGFGFPKTLLSLPGKGLTCVGHSGGWIATIDNRTGVPVEAFSVCEGAINSMATHPMKPILAIGNDGTDQSVIVLKYSSECRFGEGHAILFQNTPTPLARIRTDGDVRQVAFSGDGKKLLAALRNGDIIAIDCETWQIAWRWKCHQGGIFGMDVQNDLMVTGGHDGFVRVGRTSDGAEQLRWQAHEHRITCLTVNKNGNRIYTGTHGGEIAISDAHGQKITSLVAHVGPVLCLELSANGETLFTGGHDRRILVWDALTGDLQREIPAHTDRVMDLEFLSGDAGLLSSGFDGAVNRWGYAEDAPGQ